MKKAKNLEEKKVALSGFEPGPPDPKSTIYTPIPTSCNVIFEKIPGTDSESIFENLKHDFQAVQRCPEVQINKFQQTIA